MSEETKVDVDLIAKKVTEQVVAAMHAKMFPTTADRQANVESCQKQFGEFLKLLEDRGCALIVTVNGKPVPQEFAKIEIAQTR